MFDCPSDSLEDMIRACAERSGKKAGIVSIHIADWTPDGDMDSRIPPVGVLGEPVPIESKGEGAHDEIGEEEAGNISDVRHLTREER